MLMLLIEFLRVLLPLLVRAQSSVIRVKRLQGQVSTLALQKQQSDKHCRYTEKAATKIVEET
ncbi:MAG: hypothetical protein V2I33_25545, partial [Kangiellaceae bacterium]|nr:hypothetical protein [Kangiellaceae bacterium]